MSAADGQPDRDIAAIRQQRLQMPESAAANYLAARGMAEEVAEQLTRLKVAVRSLSASFDGELDQRNSSWMPYLADKAEAAQAAATRLVELAETAQELPS
jgi:hypothetical protein